MRGCPILAWRGVTNEVAAISEDQGLYERAPSDDAALAVVAHGLLNSISAIQMGAHALRESWDQLNADQRGEILDVVSDQAGHVRGILQDLIRGLPPEVIRALNTLDRPDGEG